VRFPRDIFRDPPGQTAIVELPTHVLATDVIDRQEYLAAGFRLPSDQVWPDTVPDEHPGVLQIWVADKPVTKMSAPPSPLLDGGTTDYWAPIAYGVDVRLRPITWRLDERNSLFAGVPGSGKSLAARTVALGAVLDPLVVPLVSELKGSGDFDAFESLCPPGMYISGADEQSKERTLEMLEWLARECDVRGPLIKGWAARGYNTDNKLNRRIAEADPRLRPLLAIFDEIQELITDKQLGKQAVALITSIVKRGRSLGIHLLLATQRIDKESVPKGISSNIVNRLCLAVQSHIETDLVLGTGAYSRGARPTKFMPPPAGANPWAGFGVLAGLSSPVRAAYLDNNAALAICERAAQLRAGGDRPEAEKVRAYNLAEDCLTVWPVQVAALWLADLLALLRGLRPDVYGELDPDALSAALRASRIAPVPVHRKLEGKGYTRAGVRFEHLQAAIEDSRLSAIDAIPAGQP
jgi:S-DNA-T family DNA segregation ATPase FtsK/SpoIIIE